MAAVAAAQGGSQDVMRQVTNLQKEISQLRSKVSELDNEMQEHMRVIKTLEPVESSRRAFRLIGGVLVEKTAGEVLPAVTEQKEQLNKLILALSDRVVDKERELSELKKKYNLTGQAGAGATQAYGGGGGQQTGILA